MRSGQDLLFAIAGGIFRGFQAGRAFEKHVGTGVREGWPVGAVAVVVMDGIAGKQVMVRA